MVKGIHAETYMLLLPAGVTKCIWSFPPLGIGHLGNYVCPSNLTNFNPVVDQLDSI